ATAPTNYDPLTIIAKDLNADNKIDLIMADGVKNATNYTAYVLQGKGDGTFTPNSFAVDSNGLSTPAALAVGEVTGDSKADLAVAGSNGIQVFTNTSTLTTVSFSAAATLAYSSNTTSLDIGRLPSGAANDIVASTVNGLIDLQINGSATF